MKRDILILSLLLLSFTIGTAASALSAANGVEFELIVRQKPAALDKYFEIDRDTINVLTGRKIKTFLVNANLDIAVATADSQKVEFTVHLTTIGATPYMQAERFSVEYNLPARIENIPGKNNSLYQLLISPRGRVTLDTALCIHDPEIESQYASDPSANFNFYFIKNSLADFHWNNIKNYIETDYVRFRDALEISTTGKINLYLTPCASPSINWDKRFGYAIDPGRSSIYTIYNHDYVSVDAILPNILRLFRVWGYAPPFLVEGLAGYFDFSLYEMRKIKAPGNLPEIKKILTTSGYLTADPHAAEVTAASFVKYLADTYGIGKVKSLYERSDDLTILPVMEEIYGRPIDSLQSLWRHYIDTLSLNRAIFDFYANRAGAIFQFDRQIEYYQEMTKYDQTRADSADTWKKLALTYYQYGHYYQAEEGYRRLIAIDSARAVYFQILGILLLIDGRYDQSWKAFDSVCTIDTTYATARLLQARIMAVRGDTAGAVKTAQNYYSMEKSIPGKIEFLLFLGKMLGARGKNYDSTLANRYYSDALTWALHLVNKAPDDPAQKLRAGLAYLGLKEYDNGAQFLESALFTEQRSYYRGEAVLALGNLYDLKKDRRRAIEYYQEGLKNPLAVYQRELCMKYIDKPYSN